MGRPLRHTYVYEKHQNTRSTHRQARLRNLPLRERYRSRNNAPVRYRAANHLQQRPHHKRHAGCGALRMSNRIDLPASQLSRGDHYLVSPGAGFMRSEKTRVVVEKIERREYKTVVYFNGGEKILYMHNDIIRNVVPA